MSLCKRDPDEGGDRPMDIQTIVTSEKESGLSIPVLYRQDAYLANLKLSLAAERYIKLPRLFSGRILDALRCELNELQAHAKDKDFTMRPYYETPRIMRTIGGQIISSESDLLKAIYRDAGLRQLINTLVGRPVYDCLDANEWMIATILNAPGNTHGWHLDDPPLALVIFADAPAADDGGLVEFIRDWPRLCTEIGIDPKGDVNPIVEQCRAAGLIEQKHHSAGDAYLFRADECLHRVTPLLRPGIQRAILNLTFELVPNVHRQGYTVGLLVE
jgi:hypothetical protein